MSSFQGIGTRFLGWKHIEGAPSSATKWVTVFFLPVFPIGRYKLIVKTRFDEEKFVTTARDSFFRGIPSQEDEYQLVEKTPLGLTEILKTLLLTYLVGPVLLFWPVVVFYISLPLLKKLPEDWLNSNGFMYVFALFAGVVVGNIILVILHAIRKSRGMRIRFIEKR